MSRTVSNNCSLVVAAALFVAGCATPAVSPVRFANQPAVWKVNDKTHVAEEPEGYSHYVSLYHFHMRWYDIWTRALEVAEYKRATNVNALDEVPDSSWFTNRIGLYDITVDDVRRGPNTDDGPVKPFVVKGTKVGGKSVGLDIRDQRGVRYLLKFDAAGRPEYETAADVIVQRLMWAVGYNVPEDTVVSFRKEDLQLADDAKIKDNFGNKTRMTQKDLDIIYTLINQSKDGNFRGLVTKFVSGKPIGGFPQEGTREGDPNDIVPHEYRRELRGLKYFYSWLQATDFKTDNTLDMWQEDPRKPGVKWVKHYLIDFGKSLGANGAVTQNAGDGHFYDYDVSWMLKSLPTLGLWKRPWEGQEGSVNLPGVGDYDTKHFHPEAYKGRHPYQTFYYSDKHDMFWGAKIAMRLSKAHIRAAVRQGKLTDPRSEDYLTETIYERARIAAKFWFATLAPLDRFTLGKGQLCYSDLMRTHGLSDVPARYAAEAFDYDGRSIRERQASLALDNGRVCVPVSDLGGDYVILRLDVARGDDGPLPPAYVHLGRRDGKLFVIGIRRE